MNEFRHAGRRARTGLLALGAAAGLALTGCTAGEAPSPDPAPAPAPTAPAPGSGGTGTAAAGEEVTAWTGQICTALLPVVETLRTPPQVDVSDPAAAQQAYTSYLNNAQTRAEQAQQEVAAAGAPPVEGGEEIAQDVQDQVADLREDLTQAQGQLDAVDPANPVDVGQAVAAGGNVLGAVGNNVQAVGAVTTDPALRDAFELAPSCAELRSAGTPG